MFSDRGATAFKVKALALATIAPGKTDEIRAAETRAALDWLYECLISANGAGNEKRISQSEDLSMRELQRPSNSANDAQTQAKARYVLAVIGHMRGETEVCVSNVAHMAAAAPRWFRTEFPTVFEHVFRPECQVAYDQLTAEMEAASAKAYRARIIVKRAAAIAVGAGVGVAVVGGMLLIGVKNGANPAVRRAIIGAAEPIWNSATRENLSVANLARIHARFEERLNAECRIMARKLL